ncbi:UNVERIFIED_CONTAM: Mismatch repair ATPase (MutS family) [Acetivibrio alkalicellulosi]
MNLDNIYQKHLKQYSDTKDNLSKKSNTISTLRLLVFIAGVLIAILGYSSFGIMYSVGVFITSMIFFVFLVVKHEKIISQVNRYKNLAQVNKDCISRMDGKWINFSKNGEDYIDYEHNYSNDLDIFGKASLYQLINTSKTYYGGLKLKNLLTNPDKNIDSIIKRQNAIKELSQKIDFCQGLECEGMLDEEVSRDPVNLIEYSQDKSKVFGKWLEWTFYILPELSILSIIICLIDRRISIYIPVFLLITHILLNLYGNTKAIYTINKVSGYKNKIKIFYKIIKLIENEHFNDQYLIELKGKLFNNKSASSQIKGLEKIVEALDLRFNPFFAFFSNILVFWNFHCVMALERWKSNSGKSIKTWIETIGMFEALSSLAMVSQLNPHWTFPQFSKKDVFFLADEMSHPLIHTEKRVCNSIKIDGEVCIITGSNMSGKTTFLRTIGINLVLAYAGAATCSKKFEPSIMDIYTSMRITDDLNQGISTFYAELLRIKMIIENSKKKNPMIFLIDEVFRGTNSEDRIIGAKNVVLNLYKDWIIGLISTHDFELCNLKNENLMNISNYHFEEKYTNNMIEFDYILKSGQCKSTNAKYLMKMVGIELKD